MSQDSIEKYLLQQSHLSAVEEFSLQHDFKQIEPERKVYEELIPKNTPGEGEQYAFAVDLDRCSGCKACVVACHHENGLEEDETWRSVGLLMGGEPSSPRLQHVTSACHHCLDPACLNGCPVNAYEKNPKTGIVKHLDDQCIGCQYCTLTCPYDVPKYNKKKGIVHKCDMCISRLEVGQAPACVKACPHGAIKITLVTTQEVKEKVDEFVAIPHAPSSKYTFPTTRYFQKEPLLANVKDVDFFQLQPQHAHAPLIWMLVLTQMSVGTFMVIVIVNCFINNFLIQRLMPLYVLMALVAGLLALGASLFHLGRPFYAFRAILGLKKSWLSREILAFGAFAFFASLFVGLYWIDPKAINVHEPMLNLAQKTTGMLTVLVGAVGVFCSAMLYKVTRRPFWDNNLTFMKFFLTAIVLGLASFLTITSVGVYLNQDLSLAMLGQPIGSILLFSLCGGIGLKILTELILFKHLRDEPLTFLKKTALLMLKVLKQWMLMRFFCGLLAVVLIGVMLFDFKNDFSKEIFLLGSGLILIFLFVGEWIERYLFFRTVVPLKMPSDPVALSGAKH